MQSGGQRYSFLDKKRHVMVTFEVVYLFGLFNNIIASQLLTFHWTVIDPYYDLTHLNETDTLLSKSVITCGIESQRRGSLIFGFVKNRHVCALFTEDFRPDIHHPWPPLDMNMYTQVKAPGRKGFLERACGFTLSIVETLMAWSDGDTECERLPEQPSQLEIWTPHMHRCVIMQLQYLRKPGWRKYWVRGIYVPFDDNWFWWSEGKRFPVDPMLWGPGQPDRTKNCTVLDASQNYLLYTADCEDKHFRLCFKTGKRLQI